MSARAKVLVGVAVAVFVLVVGYHATGPHHPAAGRVVAKRYEPAREWDSYEQTMGPLCFAYDSKTGACTYQQPAQYGWVHHYTPDRWYLTLKGCQDGDCWEDEYEVTQLVHDTTERESFVELAS